MLKRNWYIYLTYGWCWDGGELSWEWSRNVYHADILMPLCLEGLLQRIFKTHMLSLSASALKHFPFFHIFDCTSLHCLRCRGQKALPFGREKFHMPKTMTLELLLVITHLKFKHNYLGVSHAVDFGTYVWVNQHGPVQYIWFYKSMWISFCNTVKTRMLLSTP